MVAKDDDDNKKFNKSVDALEMEMLNPPPGGSSSSSNGSSASSMKSPKIPNASEIIQTLDRFGKLGRIYMELYPKATRLIGILAGILIFKLLFFRHHGKEVYMPPHLAQHYGDLQTYYDLKTAKIDHWCLRGGNDDCVCDDPTQPLGRFDVPGWNAAFERNKKTAEEASDDIDVVFLGDEFTQSWTGMKMNKQRTSGTLIESYFKRTFQKDNGGYVDGIPLGIWGDTTSNLLYRVKNGEVPDTLNPKVWWILIGANDLVVGQCSEEAVILGILRLADEIAMNKPGSIVVIQGLLPRSTFSDGALSHSKYKYADDTTTASSQQHHSKEYYKKEEYPLWPSIKVINAELEEFCKLHDHLVYFDTSKLFLGSMGNEHYQSSSKFILKDLMPDHAHPSAKGYEILAKVIGEEVNDIIYESDESNQEIGG